MILTSATILLYLVALFLTVATLWIIWYAIVSPKETGLQSFLLQIIVVIPFVMLICFGLAFIISDTISIGAVWPTVMEEELSFSEGLVVTVTYVALSGWLWLRWRKL